MTVAFQRMFGILKRWNNNQVTPSLSKPHELSYRSNSKMFCWHKKIILCAYGAENPPLIADLFNPFPAANSTSEKQNFLDEKFLVAIGKRIVAEKLLEPTINEPTFVRWKDVLEKGVSAEEREELAKKYSCTPNCACIKAPKINVELKNFLQAPVIDRDNRLILK